MILRAIHQMICLILVMFVVLVLIHRTAVVQFTELRNPYHETSRESERLDTRNVTEKCENSSSDTERIATTTQKETTNSLTMYDELRMAYPQTIHSLDRRNMTQTFEMEENGTTETPIPQQRRDTAKTYSEMFMDIRHGKFTDILSGPPIDFLPNLKNPCWVEKPKHHSVFRYNGPLNGTLRCLPYFFVSGFPKCGTTDLCRRLVTHPDILPPCQKEPHWWSRRRFGPRPIPMKSYLWCMSRASEGIEKGLNRGVNLNRLAMDCSASTIWDNTNWPEIPQNNGVFNEHTATNVHSIHRLLPNAKFIVIMRNPTDRLYSDYLYFYNLTVSPEDFHLRVNRSIHRLEECFSRHSLRSCLYNRKLFMTLAEADVRITIGTYVVYIEDWLRIYPRKNFFFLRSEDYGKNMTKCMTEIFRFLDFDVNDSILRAMKIKPRANTRSASRTSMGPMLPETRLLLEKFYTPFNKKLAHLLNNTLYLWHKDSL